jgi:hypothetical protein
MAAFGISSSYTKKSAAGGGGGDGSTSRAERAERRQDGVRASVGSSGDKHLKQTTITSSGNLQLVVLLHLVVSVIIFVLKLPISVTH